MKSLEERFWEKVDCSGDCWLWTATISRGGYGLFRLDRRMQSAHRVAYLLHHGKIDEELSVDHLCRVRHCVNPAHLEQVTQAEKVYRGESFAAKNAVKTHCPRGHSYEGNNIKPDKGRRCRKCTNERRMAKYYADKEKQKNL